MEGKRILVPSGLGKEVFFFHREKSNVKKGSVGKQTVWLANKRGEVND